MGRGGAAQSEMAHGAYWLVHYKFNHNADLIMLQNLVIWGASGHALVVAEIIRLCGKYEIVGFLDDINTKRHNNEFCGSTILGGQEQLDILRQKAVTHIILGFGDCEARIRLAKVVRTKGFELVTAIHPSAVVANDVKVGAGTVIAANAVVNPGSRLGENVIINTCASIDHECIIEDGVHISPGVRLAGRVRVGSGAWIGIGVTVIDRVQIGSKSVIGAGSVVLSNIPEGVKAYGVPARVVKNKE